MASDGGSNAKTQPIDVDCVESSHFLGGRASICNWSASIKHRTAKSRYLKPSNFWLFGHNPTHVKHLKSTFYHTHVLLYSRTTCWDHKNRMLCRRILEYLPAKVRKNHISGRPNHGMPHNWGWAANPNASDRSRDCAHLYPASFSTSLSTQVSIRPLYELKYS
jgi:hypothetical protein